MRENVENISTKGLAHTYSLKNKKQHYIICMNVYKTPTA